MGLKTYANPLLCGWVMSMSEIREDYDTVKASCAARWVRPSPCLSFWLSAKQAHENPHAAQLPPHVDRVLLGAHGPRRRRAELPGNAAAWRRAAGCFGWPGRRRWGGGAASSVKAAAGEPPMRRSGGRAAGGLEDAELWASGRRAKAQTTVAVVPPPGQAKTPAVVPSRRAKLAA